jgi:hypothetical protein
MTIFIYIYLYYIQEAIKKLSYKVFHEHLQLPDNELKEEFKKMLDDDDNCKHELTKLETKGISFDKLWGEKIYSPVSI